MLLWLFIVSSGVMVELPKHGMCCVDLHDASCGFTLGLTLLRHTRASSRESMHFCKYLYSMMIGCICSKS